MRKQCSVVIPRPRVRVPPSAPRRLAQWERNCLTNRRSQVRILYLRPIMRGISSVGRATALQAVGQGFKSLILHQYDCRYVGFIYVFYIKYSRRVFDMEHGLVALESAMKASNDFNLLH